MNAEYAAALVVGDQVEFNTGNQLVLAEVVQEYGDRGSHKGKTVRVDTGVFSTEAAPEELRP